MPGNLFSFISWVDPQQRYWVTALVAEWAIQRFSYPPAAALFYWIMWVSFKPRFYQDIFRVLFFSQILSMFWLVPPAWHLLLQWFLLFQALLNSFDTYICHCDKIDWDENLLNRVPLASFSVSSDPFKSHLSIKQKCHEKNN